MMWHGKQLCVCVCVKPVQLHSCGRAEFFLLGDPRETRLWVSGQHMADVRTCVTAEQEAEPATAVVGS